MSRADEIRARLTSVPAGYVWLRDDVAWLLEELARVEGERDAEELEALRRVVRAQYVLGLLDATDDGMRAAGLGDAAAKTAVERALRGGVP